MKNLIVITGKQGSGKTTFRRFITSQYNKLEICHLQKEAEASYLIREGIKVVVMEEGDWEKDKDWLLYFTAQTSIKIDRKHQESIYIKMPMFIYETTQQVAPSRHYLVVNTNYNSDPPNQLERFTRYQQSLHYVMEHTGTDDLYFTRKDLSEMFPDLIKFGELIKFIQFIKAQPINKINNRHKQKRYTKRILKNGKIEISQNKIGRVFLVRLKSA